MSASLVPHRRLRNRMMLVFAAFTLVLAALFGLYTLLFVYTVEDQLFDTLLEREAATQRDHYATHGRWSPPRNGFMSVVERRDDLPDGIGRVLREEPARREFAGANGRHYHLLALDPPAPATRAWLVAEVSGLLAVRPMRGEMLHLLAWTGAIAVVLALLLGGWLARRTTAPLSRLADAVGEATPERLPPHFAADFPDDEVGLLARRLDDLIARVRAFIDREREFTRDASHELRTPLTVIRAASERLSADTTLSADARASVEHIGQSASHLEQTVALLLALAREQPALPTASTPVTRVLPVLERVVVEQSPLLEGKHVQVAVEVPADLTSTLTVPVLQVLLANLIGNAFAHTREGDVVIVADGDALCISNPGHAVREGDFAPFAKSEDSTGFGLGLSIVRRLCERHAIDLRFESNADGSTARLRLRQDAPGSISPASRTP
ncbi:sensor histidine kinase [Pseudoxanthomonas mexicana]